MNRSTVQCSGKRMLTLLELTAGVEGSRWVEEGTAPGRIPSTKTLERLIACRSSTLLCLLAMRSVLMRCLSNVTCILLPCITLWKPDRVIVPQIQTVGPSCVGWCSSCFHSGFYPVATALFPVSVLLHPLLLWSLARSPWSVPPHGSLQAPPCSHRWHPDHTCAVGHSRFPSLPVHPSVTSNDTFWPQCPSD